MSLKLCGCCIRLFACRTAMAAVALALMGFLAREARADNLQGQQIYVQNNTNVTLWVAARYIPPGGGDGAYVNNGYWQIEPGQKMLIVYNNGVLLHLGARLNDGTIARLNGNPMRQTIRGLPVDLYPFDTGDDYNPRVITLR